MFSPPPTLRLEITTLNISARFQCSALSCCVKTSRDIHGFMPTFVQAAAQRLSVFFPLSRRAGVQEPGQIIVLAMSQYQHCAEQLIFGTKVEASWSGAITKPPTGWTCCQLRAASPLDGFAEPCLRFANPATDPTNRSASLTLPNRIPKYTPLHPRGHVPEFVLKPLSTQLMRWKSIC